MTKGDRPLTQCTGLTEHLTFAALLSPTFVLIAAGTLSLASPDSSVAVQAAGMHTVAACEVCARDNGEQGP
jgi:hypothetical protein